MYRFHPIGCIHSGFPEKFGIPRQAGLVPEATAVLELFAPYGRAETLAGLETFSHLWVVFVFHAHLKRSWHPTVRPPRLGGNRRIGLFASRSAFRPNPIGMSAVRLAGIRQAGNRAEIEIGGGDFLDGTPVLDIKPYLPYADAIAEATGGYAAAAPPRLPVAFSPEAEAACRRIDDGSLKDLIAGVLANDPRPAYDGKRDAKTVYGMRIRDLDVHWRVSEGRVTVVSVAAFPPVDKPSTNGLAP
ncbi:MAG: tRNA (N6-threonylcarbamoyladenosine(37)-N6)-methyltransferase TrmO [Desulfobacterales bacterium]|nr:tRNA (N6-threonylcarbamoyladenosine(37)-N6)-methyltransferase TrmO [Desulfobacteraceae bacterium]MDY0312604.1 tRNA (N6-threonylcarbamoyladenosine(37)-N6)-methyltransferase TrmO [Desulfobacterales bacterium]